MGTTPCDGFIPTTPQAAAGSRNDPAASVPWARAVACVASAATAPPDEPAVPRERSQGLRVSPKSRLSVTDAHPNSGVFVRAWITAPASRRRWTAGSVSTAIRSLNARDASVCGWPATGVSSLTARGKPSSGPQASGCARSRCSERRASARASSGNSCVKALNMSCARSAWARKADVTSTGDSARVRMRLASSTADF